MSARQIAAAARGWKRASTREMMALVMDETPVSIEERGPAAYVAEFIGTFFLVLFIVMAVIGSGPRGIGATDWAVIGLAHPPIPFALVHAPGCTSGAHLNPAITATLTALRKITPQDATIYVILQLAGGVAAAIVAKAILKDEGAAVNYGAPAVSPKITDLGGFICELIGTFVLMWAVMAAAVNPRAERGWAGLMIGGALGVSVLAFGWLTSGAFKPARSFGTALVTGKGGVAEAGTFSLVYVIAPVVGSFLAGVGYTALVLRPQAEEFGVEDIAV